MNSEGRQLYRHNRVYALFASMFIWFWIPEWSKFPSDYNFVRFFVIAVGVPLTVYQLMATLKRRIEIDSDGVRSYDWLGKLEFNVPWDEVQGIEYPLSMNDGESSSHRLYTSKGSTNIIYMSRYRELEAHVNRELVKRGKVLKKFD